MPATSREMWAGVRSGQRGLEEEGGLGRLGPCPFSKPGSPRLPSPAWHLSHPDNGTSPGGACACVPAHRPEGERGFPGGHAGRRGGKRGSGHGAERDAGPASRTRPPLQRGCLRSQTSPSSKGLPTRQRRPRVRGGSYRRLRPSSRPPWPRRAGRGVRASATPARAGGRLCGLQRPAPARAPPSPPGPLREPSPMGSPARAEAGAGPGRGQGRGRLGKGWYLNLCFFSGLP